MFSFTTTKLHVGEIFIYMIIFLIVRNTLYKQLVSPERKVGTQRTTASLHQVKQCAVSIGMTPVKGVWVNVNTGLL